MASDVKLLRNIFLRCLLVFVVITIGGLLLMHAYNRRMQEIEVGCGLHSNPDVQWIEDCTRSYSRHHMGVTQWWGPVLTTGVTGSAVSGVLWVVSFSGRSRSRHGSAEDKKYFS